MEKKITENIKGIVFVGEVIEKNEVFLELKLCMFDNHTNLNNVRYTDAFLQEIVDNQDKYVCLPLVCDTWSLLNNEKMTHMYDINEGRFYTSQIGSFKKFETEKGEDGLVKLIGYARVPKRNEEICEALNFLHEHGELKFSYEIKAKTYSVEDGVTIVDVADENRLIGIAVVSDPAYPNAVSLMVAENQEKGGENMEKQTVDTSAVLANAEEMQQEVIEDKKEIEVKEEVEQGKCDTDPEKKTGEEDLTVKVGELLNIITDLKAEVAELKVYKEKFETAEQLKAEEERKIKIAELRAKAEKVLDETELAEIEEAIESLNEVVVMTKIGDKYIAEHMEKEQIKIANVVEPKKEYRIVDGMKVDNKDKYFSV